MTFPLTSTLTLIPSQGANIVTKIMTEETIITSNGEKTVYSTETTKSRPATLSQASRVEPGPNSSSSSSDSSPVCHGSVPQKNSSSTTARPQTMGDFQRDCLKAHNAKRGRHGVEPLSLANDLSRKAQKWAEHLAAKNLFEHNDSKVNGNKVGENVAQYWCSDPEQADCKVEEVVNTWYDEIKGYSYSSERAIGFGHFTQVVWKGSKELGVGKAKDGKGKCFVVCSYRPAGNMMGAYKENVSRPM